MTTPTELEDMRLKMEHFKREAEALRSGACTCGLVKNFLAAGTHVADCASLVYKRIREEALAQHEAEHRALLADNAALLNGTADAERMLECGSERFDVESHLCGLRMQPHPGAALLSELEALRSERDEARAQVLEWRKRALFAEDALGVANDEARTHVAKVREVLQRIGRDVYTAPVPYVIQKAAESLGINLDGEP